MVATSVSAKKSFNKGALATVATVATCLPPAASCWLAGHPVAEQHRWLVVCVLASPMSMARLSLSKLMGVGISVKKEQQQRIQARTGSGICSKQFLEARPMARLDAGAHPIYQGYPDTSVVGF